MRSSLTLLESLLVGVGSNLGASLQIVASITANLGGIQQSIQTALTNIIAQTSGAVGGIIGVAAGFTQAQIDTLKAALVTLARVISGLGLSLVIQATDLTPAILSTLTAMIKAIQAAIVPLVTPLSILAQAIHDFSITTNLNIIGLENASAGLQQIVISIVKSLFGLP